MSIVKGWTIEPPDHNSTWWGASRPSGKVTESGESIPECMGATTRAALLRMIAREASEAARTAAIAAHALGHADDERRHLDALALIERQS